MHRLPKLFSHNRLDGRPKSKRLDRRNALKNVDYDASPSTSTSTPSYSSEESLRTRSADLYSDRTIFRVDGTDGEFDVICRAFGFSGIDDFQISSEEFETMKVRSSSAPVVFKQAFEPVIYQEEPISGASNDSISNHAHENRGVNYTDRIRANAIGAGGASELSNRFVDSVRVSELSFSDSNISRRSAGHRGNGIKGVRPPLLAPPIVDAYAPNPERGYCLDEGEEAPEEMNPSRINQERRNSVLLETCSFSTTSNDDDSSSTTTEPTLSISPNRRFRRIIKDWQKGDLLGRGSFGSVYEGISDDGFFFAVKEVCLLDQGEEGKQRILQLEQEIALLSQFQHENIVQYYGTNKGESHIYIFLELVTKGSLLSLYQKYDLRVPQVSAYTRQILRGLKYLHDRNVIHRDIKCANILVHTNGLVKLADFGLAKAVKLNDVKSCKGTAFWMAPEVVRSHWYGLAADIWSLGCTVLEMLTRRFPYSNMECKMAALYRIGRGERPAIPDSLPSEAQDFIVKCLQVDPGLRPTASQLLDHPFVKGME